MCARRVRARVAAAIAQKREGPAPIRAGSRSAARTASTVPSSEPPCSRRRPRASKHADPGRSLSTAAPTASRRASTRSHASATPTGSGGVSASRGARASASPSRIPGMDAERLGRLRDLADELLAPRLGRQRHRPLRERRAAAGGDGELEAGQEDADDHDRTHVRMRGPGHARGFARMGACPPNCTSRARSPRSTSASRR